MNQRDPEHNRKLLEMAREQRVWEQENQDIIKDETGTATFMQGGGARHLGILLYFVEHDIKGFKSGLRKSAENQLSLFERFAAGEPITRTNMTIGSFREVYDALAAGDYALAQRLSAHVGRWTVLDAEFQLKSIAAFGRMLKAFVDGASEEECRAATSASLRTMAKDFDGYPMVFNALLDRDLDAAQKGFAAIIAGHKRASKGKGDFVGTDDELLCVWGLGLANLCHWRGLAVEINDPLIPAELLVEMELR
jgi:hypothetical protein